MDYLSPAPHQLNVVVSVDFNFEHIYHSHFFVFIEIAVYIPIFKLLQDTGAGSLDNTWSKTRDESASSWFYNSAGWGERK